jgi:hypothetical protein
MNGKWLLSVGLPLVLLTAGVAVAGPLVYMSVSYNTDYNADPNVVLLNDKLVQVNCSGTEIWLNLNVWIQDAAAIHLGSGSSGYGEPNVGLQCASFGVKSSTGGLLGNLLWYPNGVAWMGAGYLAGGSFDPDVDTDLDVGGPYKTTFDVHARDANFGDYPAASSGGTGYNFWTIKTGLTPPQYKWVKNTDAGALDPQIMGPDGNQYYGFQVGIMSFDVASPFTPGLSTDVEMYPFWYAGVALYSQRFMIEGMQYNVNEPFDPNYSGLPDSDPNRQKMYVYDLSQYQVQADSPMSIVFIPEPTVVILTLVGAVGLLSRRRRKA